MAGQPRPSTKQKKFARLVAQGTGQTDAYEAVYGNRGGKRKTHTRDAHELVHQPSMRELIAKYEAQLVPLGDLRTEQENALSNLKYLAFDSPDHKVRVTASVKLFELLEVFRERQHKYKRLEQGAIPVDAVVTELLQLAESQPVIEMETSEITEDSSEPDTDPVDQSD